MSFIHKISLINCFIHRFTIGIFHATITLCHTSGKTQYQDEKATR